MRWHNLPKKSSFDKFFPNSSNSRSISENVPCLESNFCIYALGRRIPNLIRTPTTKHSLVMELLLLGLGMEQSLFVKYFCTAPKYRGGVQNEQQFVFAYMQFWGYIERLFRNKLLIFIFFNRERCILTTFTKSDYSVGFCENVQIIVKKYESTSISSILYASGVPSFLL